MAGDLNWSSVVFLCHADGANASTVFHDSSLSNHTISESFGGQLGTAEAAFGTASFDFVANHGSGPCINASTNGGTDYQFGSGHFTVECSVYPTSSNPNGFIMHTGLQSSTEVGWGLFYDSSTTTLYFIYSTDGSTLIDIDGSCTLALNTWTAIAADYDGTTCRLYAGGVVIASSTLSGALFATTSDISFGNDNHTDSNTWNGYIDEARVTKGVARYAGAYTPAIAAFPAYGSSPQPENIANSGNGAGSGNVTNASLTYNVTTWEPNDILVVAVYNTDAGTGNPAVVASITSSGLTFAQRSSVSAAFGGGMEVWWALATTPLIAQSMTIAFTGTFDDASSVAYGVAGCYTASPWDSNGSLPATASGFSITGVSTSQSDDCLLSFVGSTSGPGNPFGYTVIAATDTFGGSLGSAITTGYSEVSAPQSSLSPAAATGAAPAFIIDALTADSSAINASPSITGVEGDGQEGTFQFQFDNSFSLTGAFALGLAEMFAEVGDPSWIVTGAWFTDTSTSTGQERIFTTAFASTNIEATFSGDWLNITVQTSLSWGDIGVYAADDSTLLDTVTCNIDTGGQLNTTTLTGFGPGSHTIFLQKTVNDSNPIVLVSLAWQDIVANPSSPIAGVAATGSVGSVGTETDMPVTGASATGSAATLMDQVVVIIGVPATGLAGSLTTETDAAVNLSGVSATGSLGSIAILERILTLASVSATGSAQALDLQINGNQFIWVDGASAAGTAAVLRDEVDQAVGGASASGLAGTPQGGITATAITGASATSSAASLPFEVDSNASVNSASGIGLAGNTGFSIDGSLTVWLDDVSAVGGVGSVGVKIDASTAVSATGSAGTIQFAAITSVAGVSATGLAGAVAITVHDSPILIGVSAIGAAGLGAFLGSNPAKVSAPITGVTATGAAGTTTTSSFNNVTGINLPAVVATGSAGNFTFAFSNSVTPVGVAGTGIAGQIHQAPSIQGVAGAGSVILGNTVGVFDIGGITGQNVSSLTITTTTTVPKGGVIVVGVALNSVTLVIVSDGTNTYSTTSTTYGTGTVAQISWTAPLSAPLLAGSSITLTPLGLMSGAASAFYLTNVTTAAQTTSGSASSVPSTTPIATDVNPGFANTYVVEALAANGPFSDIFTQDPHGWSNFPVKRGTSGGGGNFYVAGGTQWWAYGILTYAPTITAESWALTGVGFTVDANITTAEQVHTTGVAGTGTAASLSGLAFKGVSSTGSAGTVTPTGANIVELSPTGVAATGSAGAFTFIIDAILTGVAGTGMAGVLFPRAATTFFVVT